MPPPRRCQWCCCLVNETTSSCCCCPKRVVLFNTSVVVVVEVLNRRNYAKIVEVGISALSNMSKESYRKGQKSPGFCPKCYRNGEYWEDVKWDHTH